MVCKNWECESLSGDYYGSAPDGNYIVQLDYLLALSDELEVWAYPFTTQNQDAVIANMSWYREKWDEKWAEEEDIVDPFATKKVTAYRVYCSPTSDNCDVGTPAGNSQSVPRATVWKTVPFADVPAENGDWFYCSQEFCYLTNDDTVFGTNPYYGGFNRG